MEATTPMNSVRRKFVAGRGRSSAGMTLVEVMVVVAVSTVLLSLVVTLAISLKQADRRMRHHGVTSARLVVVAERLRSDIRRGTDVSPSAGNVLVVTGTGGEQQRYELGPEGCRRSVVKPGEVAPRGDLFAIGPAASWTIDEDAAGRHTLFIVTLNRPEPDDVNKRQRGMPLLVYAALGADLPVAAGSASEN